MPFRDVLGQQHAVETIRRGLSSGRLHHALLFVGPDGVGKELTAFSLACALVCTVARGEGCGTCSACLRALSSTVEGADESHGSSVPLHPDVVVVERGLYPKEVLGRTTDEKTDISVDQIRRVVLARASLPPHEASQRIVIVRRAEEMSVGAANALLKTLEEPSQHTRFVLLTARPGELLPTIRSRTQPVRFGPLADDLVERILLTKGIDAAQAKEVAPLASGSVETGVLLADPERSTERARAVEALRTAARGPQAALLEVTSSYANSGDDRRRLRDHLSALMMVEATEVRRLLLSGSQLPGAKDAAVDAALARHDAALVVSEALDHNANVPLALEATWLGLPRRTM
jgi:DNA polymerase III subunit delta'